MARISYSMAAGEGEGEAAGALEQGSFLPYLTELSYLRYFVCYLEGPQ